jgi:hypothetical protein
MRMSWVRTIIAAAGVLSLSVPTVGATPARFTIEAGQGSANAGNNFNGTVDGHLVVTVPLGAQVELTLTNQGQLPHSIQVISSGGSLPISAVPASALAFPSAQTSNPQAGAPGTDRRRPVHRDEGGSVPHDLWVPWPRRDRTVGHIRRGAVVDGEADSHDAVGCHSSRKGGSACHTSAGGI